MKFTIEEFKKLELNPESFVLLYAIVNKDKEVEKIVTLKGDIHATARNLEQKGYIKIMEDNSWILRKKALSLQTQTLEKRAQNLLESFRGKFPLGSNSGGYRYRGDKQGCLVKLKKFIKDNPQWTDGEILKATENYISRFEPEYIGMRQAHYFIEKNGISDLLGELEVLNEKPAVNKSSITKMI